MIQETANKTMFLEAFPVPMLCFMAFLTVMVTGLTLADWTLIILDRFYPIKGA